MNFSDTVLFGLFKKFLKYIESKYKSPANHVHNGVDPTDAARLRDDDEDDAEEVLGPGVGAGVATGVGAGVAAGTSVTITCVGERWKITGRKAVNSYF